jgi:hypothetical protein
LQPGIRYRKKAMTREPRSTNVPKHAARVNQGGVDGGVGGSGGNNGRGGDINRTVYEKTTAYFRFTLLWHTDAGSGRIAPPTLARHHFVQHESAFDRGGFSCACNIFSIFRSWRRFPPRRTTWTHGSKANLLAYPERSFSDVVKKSLITLFSFFL